MLPQTVKFYEPMIANLIKELGLRKSGRKTIEKAITQGFLSVADLANLIPHFVAKDTVGLEKVINQIQVFAVIMKVVIIPTEIAEKLKQTRKIIPLDAETADRSDRELELIHEDVPMDSNQLLKIYKRDVKRFAILNVEDERFFSQRALEGDLTSRNVLAEHNLRLSMHVAHRFGGRGIGLEYLDLIQEGNDGLTNAAEKYDGSLGYKFSTYAVRGIKNYIIRGIQNYSGTVRLPVSVRKKCYKIEKASNELFQKLGREPSVDEISESASMPVNEVSHLLKLIKSTTVRLDSPINEDDSDENYHSFIADISTISPDQLLEAKEELETITQNIRRFLKKVSSRCLARDYEMFKIRYGFDDKNLEKKTLETIASRFNMSRQRVFQVMERIWKISEITDIQENEEWLEKQIELVKEIENIVGLIVEI